MLSSSLSGESSASTEDSEESDMPQGAQIGVNWKNTRGNRGIGNGKIMLLPSQQQLMCVRCSPKGCCWSALSIGRIIRGMGNRIIGDGN